MTSVMGNLMGQWEDDWNTIIRKVIFADDELKTLMKVPEGTGIIPFIDKYFVRAGYTNELLENECVRIVYSDNQGYDTSAPNVMRKMMTFDIYVKQEDQHNVENDRLVMRTRRIASRLHQLLTDERYVEKTGYRFWIAGDWDLGTRTIGYARYVLALYYMKVY